MRFDRRGRRGGRSGNTGASLVQLERFDEIDLGTRIVMDWKPIGERSRAVSDERKKVGGLTQARAARCAWLDRLSQHRKRTAREGCVIYIKSSVSGDENDYILSYKAANAAFPHETTIDQLFTEEQFEAYRALGEHIAGRFLSGSDIATTCPDIGFEYPEKAS